MPPPPTIDLSERLNVLLSNTPWLLQISAQCDQPRWSAGDVELGHYRKIGQRDDSDAAIPWVGQRDLLATRHDGRGVVPRMPFDLIWAHSDRMHLLCIAVVVRVAIDAAARLASIVYSRHSPAF